MRTTPSQLYWEGCNTSPTGTELYRSCSGPYQLQYQANVATTSSPPWGTSSYTIGPKSTATVPTLLVSLEGKPLGDENIPALNASNTWTPLGRVVMTNSPGVPPDLTVNGLQLLPV